MVGTRKSTGLPGMFFVKDNYVGFTHAQVGTGAQMPENHDRSSLIREGVSRPKVVRREFGIQHPEDRLDNAIPGQPCYCRPYAGCLLVECKRYLLFTLRSCCPVGPSIGDQFYRDLNRIDTKVIVLELIVADPSVPSRQRQGR